MIGLAAGTHAGLLEQVVAGLLWWAGAVVAGKLCLGGGRCCGGSVLVWAVKPCLGGAGVGGTGKLWLCPLVGAG